MTKLSDQMRSIAKAQHPRSVELVQKAAALDEAAAGFSAEPQTVSPKSFLGAYARARIAYCAVTGEPLV